MQPELGLNWHDYGARMYQADLGRFFNPDRFAKDYYDFTPYHYTLNNPIIFVDVNGDSTIVSQALETLRTAPADIKQGFKQMGAFIVSDIVKPIGDAAGAVGDAAKKAGDFVDSFFQDGKGSGLISDNFHNEDTRARKGENQGDINVDPFIGPTLRTDPASNLLEGVMLGIAMGTTIEGATNVIENTVKKLEESKEQGGATPKRDTVDISGGESIEHNSKGEIQFGTIRAVVLPQNDTIIRKVKKEEILQNR